MSAATLSVIIIARNEEANIVPCLDSVAWADERIVVDSRSTDRTVELARPLAQKVIETDWLGYAGTKNLALSHAAGEWVLWLDADERVTPELGEEIRTMLCAGTERCDAFEVARRAYFLGRWIRHSGWYPGYVTRLFRRKEARFSQHSVHERLELPPGAKVGLLRSDLLHYTDETLYHYFQKFNRYTSLAARDLHEAGARFSVTPLLVKPPYLFMRMYIVKRGFLDGMQGLILALASAAYVFCKYAKLYRIAS